MRKSQIKTSNIENVSHTEKQQEPSQRETAILSPTGQAWRRSTVFSCHLLSSPTGTRSNRRGRSHRRLKNPGRSFSLVHGYTNTPAAGTPTSPSSHEKQVTGKPLQRCLQKDVLCAGENFSLTKTKHRIIELIWKDCCGFPVNKLIHFIRLDAKFLTDSSTSEDASWRLAAVEEVWKATARRLNQDSTSTPKIKIQKTVFINPLMTIKF